MQKKDAVFVVSIFLSSNIRRKLEHSYSTIIWLSNVQKEYLEKGGDTFFLGYTDNNHRLSSHFDMHLLFRWWDCCVGKYGNEKEGIFSLSEVKACVNWRRESC